jgi:hypothetical protein
MGKSPAKLNKAASAKKVVVSEAHVVNKENDLCQFSQLSAKVDDMMKLMQGFMSSRGRNGKYSSIPKMLLSGSMMFADVSGVNQLQNS